VVRESAPSLDDAPPLYRIETLYRLALESLQTREWSAGAYRSLVDRWFFDLEALLAARSGSTSRD